MHPTTAAFVDAAAGLGIRVEPRTFPEGTRTADDAAAAIGVDVGQIVKSLAFRAVHADGSGFVVMALVSGSNRLDEAASRHAELTPRFCDAWLDALAHSRDLEHGPQIAARVELLFVPTMTDAQRLRFDVLRTELPKAQAQPEQETVVPNDS